MTYVGAKRVLQWHLIAGGRDLEQRTLDGRYVFWRAAHDQLDGPSERWSAAAITPKGSELVITDRSPSRLDALLACEEHAQSDFGMPK